MTDVQTSQNVDQKNSLESKVDDILTIVQFMQNEMVTRTEFKKELDDLEKSMDEKLKKLRDEMIEHVDGFIALYQKHEVELAAVVSRQNRLEKKVEMLMKHLNLQIAE